MDHILKKGYLSVPGGHAIYFEEWGNLNAPVLFYLHGGPGSHFSENTKLLFNPAIQHVVFHDQRGCGRSTPYASTVNNTTQDLLADISLLAEYLGIEKFILVGGSWGSSLALLYTIANPHKVVRLLLWSIYLVRELETNYVNEGYAQYWFPEAWQRFITNVPEKQRTDGYKIMAYYAQKIRSRDTQEAKRYADEWTLWEATLLSLTYVPEKTEQMVMEEDNRALAILETEYFLHHCYIPENYILANIPKIQHIPCHIVQGRFDMCTPPVGAFDLSNTYGEKATLEWTMAGHLRFEPENLKAIKRQLQKKSYSHKGDKKKRK